MGTSLLEDTGIDLATELIGDIHRNNMYQSGFHSGFSSRGGKSDDCHTKGGGARTIVVLWYFFEHVYENVHPRNLLEI